MLTLIIPASEPTKYADVIQRLDDLRLAFRLESDGQHSQPTLIDGATTSVGQENIHKHIDELERFRAKWYNCHCG